MSSFIPKPFLIALISVLGIEVVDVIKFDPLLNMIVKLTIGILTIIYLYRKIKFQKR